MQIGKIVVYVVLFSCCFIGDVFAGTTFIKPVDGWVRFQNDKYDQFEEDYDTWEESTHTQYHPCTENGDHSKCYSTGGYPAERHCGYGDQCSNRSGHSMHAAFDYDKPLHSGHGSPNVQHGGGEYHGSADDIKATNDGVIANVTFNGDQDYGFGNTVVIKHTNLVGCTSAVCPDDQIYSQASHMSNGCGDDRPFGKGVRADTGELFDIEPGVYVSQGDIIGCIGGTGYDQVNTWIDHLHFEFKTWSSVYDSGISGCGKNGSSATYGYPHVADNRADIGTIKAELFACGYRDPADFLGKVSVGSSNTDNAQGYFYVSENYIHIAWSPSNVPCDKASIWAYDQTCSAQNNHPEICQTAYNRLLQENYGEYSKYKYQTMFFGSTENFQQFCQ